MTNQETDNFQTQVDEIVELIVSGTSMMTTYNKLTQVPNSQLAKLIKDSQTKKTKDGKIFIDRDVDAFGSLLSYLRNDMKTIIFESDYQYKKFELEL